MIYVKPHLFSVSTDGIAQCFKAADGERLWRQRLGGAYSASPLFADGKLYFLNDAGETTVIEAAAKYKLLHKNALGEHCQASIAASRGQLFIRTEKHLYCIGKAAK
jgi:outer membrane protein assembly factor BamB